jgi:hypothetical protein
MLALLLESEAGGEARPNGFSDPAPGVAGRPRRLELVAWSLALLSLRLLSAVMAEAEVGEADRKGGGAARASAGRPSGPTISGEGSFGDLTPCCLR